MKEKVRMKQMRLLTRGIVFLFTLAATTSALYAQIGITIDTLDAGNFPQIVMKVRVMNGTTLLKGLTLGNFTVYEDTTIQNTVAGYCDDTTSTPVSVLLIIDKSGSMGPGVLGSNAIVAAKLAAKNFIDRLSMNDEEALVSFNDAISYDQSWTANKTLIKTKIDAITTGNGTHLWDAVIQGSSIIKDRTKKRVIIILTDGNDATSNNTFQTALNSAVASKAIIYSIGLGNGIDVTHLTQLATATGGKYYNAPSGSDLDAIYQQISQQISSNGFCELRYTSKIDCYNGADHTVTVQVRYNGQVYQATTTFKAPYDPSTFSYVTLSMDRNYVVESGDTISVVLDLTKVSTNRPPSVFQFKLDYDTDALLLESAKTTALSKDYTVTVTPTPTGSSLIVQGAKAIKTPGTLLTLLFRAASLPQSRKSIVTVSPPVVQQYCTIATSIDGLITVSGYCERAISRGQVIRKTTTVISNTPNPFNPSTTIYYSVEMDGLVTMTLFDAIGREIRTIIREPQKAGDHAFFFDGADLPTGMYIVKLSSNDIISTRRIMLLK